MKPCEPTAEASFHLTPSAENLFPDSLELPGRPAVIFRGCRLDAIVRADTGDPELAASPHRLSRRGRRSDGPPADGS